MGKKKSFSLLSSCFGKNQHNNLLNSKLFPKNTYIYLIQGILNCQLKKGLDL